MKKNILFSQPVINVNKTISLIKKVFINNFPNEGKFTHIFEKKISKILGVKYVVATTNGTSSIFLALKAINVQYGDEVIVPNITFPATANAVKLAGAKVILADVDKQNLLIDINDIKKKITKKTKAIIPVHISGRGCNVEKIIKIAKSKKIHVIEDAAEAFASKQNGKCLGTFGDMGCFSFAPNKIITTGQGGIVVTNKKKLFLSLKKLKDQGRTKVNPGGEDRYRSLGYNFKFTDMQAALGLAQIQELKERINILKKNYNIYKKELRDLKSFKLIGFNISKGEVPLWIDAHCENRKDLFSFLKNKKINCRYFWQPLNLNKSYEQSFSKLTISKKLYKKLIWLPSALNLKKKNILKITKLIRYFYS